MAEIKRFEYKLGRPAIAEIIESIDSFLTKSDSKRKIQVTFLLESILLDLYSYYESQINVEVTLSKRFGRYSIKVVYDGKKFNPSEAEDTPLQTHHFLNYWGLTPSYNYANNLNELTINIPFKRLNNEHFMFIALVLSFIAGLIKPVIPNIAVSFISNYLLSAISGIFLDLLGGFAGFMIFFQYCPAYAVWVHWLNSIKRENTFW